MWNPRHWGHGSEVEYLPIMHETLDLISSTIKRDEHRTQGYTFQCPGHSSLSNSVGPSGSGEGWTVVPPIILQCLPHPIHQGAPRTSFPVSLQVAGRCQPGDPGYHRFLQSQSETGGVPGRVSPAPPRAPAHPACLPGL